jgi:MoaA/NifB/PqqE/SkfB family radical SAM enzyme
MMEAITTSAAVSERAAAAVTQTKELDFGSRQRIISGWLMSVMQLRIHLSMLRLLLKRYKRLSLCLRIMKQLEAKRHATLGKHRLEKLAFVDGKYYYDLYTPGWPSTAFDKYILGEAARIDPADGASNRFTNIFLAITKKCPLRCEHCFEWDALNGKEKLTLDDIRHMVRSFKSRGTGQIQFTGGEPLLRAHDIATVVAEEDDSTQFWVLSSGFNLSSANAEKLKAAGLTGIVVSLDHFDPEMHNAFRGFQDAYGWVVEGVKNAKAVGLVVALSICVTRAFVTHENLMRYIRLAKAMGVSIIQILEPKAVGHYKGADVVLKREHEEILERFYLMMNYEKEYRDYPIVTYHGYHQRHTGCFGAGNRNLYVDTDGDIHACPFCQVKRGSALSGDLDAAIRGLSGVGCHDFRASGI